MNIRDLSLACWLIIWGVFAQAGQAEASTDHGAIEDDGVAVCYRDELDASYANYSGPYYFYLTNPSTSSTPNTTLDLEYFLMADTTGDSIPDSFHNSSVPIGWDGTYAGQRNVITSDASIIGTHSHHTVPIPSNGVYMRASGDTTIKRFPTYERTTVTGRTSGSSVYSVYYCLSSEGNTITYDNAGFRHPLESSTSTSPPYTYIDHDGSDYYLLDYGTISDLIPVSSGSGVSLPTIPEFITEGVLFSPSILIDSEGTARVLSHSLSAVISLPEYTFFGDTYESGEIDYFIFHEGDTPLSLTDVGMRLSYAKYRSDLMALSSTDSFELAFVCDSSSDPLPDFGSLGYTSLPFSPTDFDDSVNIATPLTCSSGENMHTILVRTGRDMEDDESIQVSFALEGNLGDRNEFQQIPINSGEDSSCPINSTVLCLGWDVITEGAIQVFSFIHNRIKDSIDPIVSIVAFWEIEPDETYTFEFNGETYSNTYAPMEESGLFDFLFLSGIFISLSFYFRFFSNK